MLRQSTVLGFLTLLTLLTGCQPTPPEPKKTVESRFYPPPSTPTITTVTADSDRDRKFFEDIQPHSGGMIARAAIGLEKAGMIRFDLDRSVNPDDALEMARKVIRQARTDFPDRPITLALFDPGAQPILKVRFRPGTGVHFQLTPTESDRKFAQWVKDKAGLDLVYVEVSLDRHRLIWVGVGSGFDRARLSDQFRPILNQARKEVPTGEIQLLALNPEGDPIGKARISENGTIRWEP